MTSKCGPVTCVVDSHSTACLVLWVVQEEDAALFEEHMARLTATHPELKPFATKSVELLTPIRAFNLLARVTEEDAILVWMDASFGRPDSLVMWTVPVPPVPIRPSVPQEMGGGSTEDDITIKLQEIIEMNNALKMALDQGATMKMIAEDWEFLQVRVSHTTRNHSVPPSNPFLICLLSHCATVYLNGCTLFHTNRSK